MSDKPLYKVVRDEHSSASDDVVEFVERLVNSPEFRERGEAAFKEEWVRQVGYGLPPSNGLPDIRRAFSARRNVYYFGDGDGSGLHNQWKGGDAPPRTQEEEER